MILDARNGFGDSASYDIVIVGAGPAGISLALELDGAGHRVCLLEAGGLSYERDTQALLEGEAEGLEYPALRDTRLAAFGGTTGVWAGWCRPLEASDFLQQVGDVAAAWPFTRDALLPYYRRAQLACGLGDLSFEIDDWRGRLGDEPRLADDPAFVPRIFLVSGQRFGERYLAALRRSANIDLVLHAPVARLETAADKSRVTHAEIRTPDGRAARLAAGTFVLAAGGIENPRLLLSSAESPAAAPGNGSGLLGRYFTDHPFVDPGTLVFDDAPRSLEFFMPQVVARADAARTSVRAVLEACDDALPGGTRKAALFFHPRYEAHPAFESEAVRALLRAWAKLGRRAVPGNQLPGLLRGATAPRLAAVAALRKLFVKDGPAKRWRMRAMFESESRFENRVVLADQRDRLGRRRARIEWRLGERDLAHMRGVIARFERSLEHSGAARLERAFPDEPDAWRAAIEAGKHHMGTTRMHADPRQGVVDDNGRVHGTSNLFVTGSSVFPTGGYANPTLTIVALAIRLADHLKGLH